MTLSKLSAILSNMKATKSKKQKKGTPPGTTKVSTFLMPEAHRLARSQAALRGQTLCEWMFAAILEKINRDK